VGGLLRCPQRGRYLPVSQFYAHPSCVHELRGRVSAFNWRAALLCKPDDARETHTGDPYLPVKFPERYCLTVSKEARTIHGKYGSDVNLLAEALCPPEDLRLTAEAPHGYDEAVRDSAQIGHAKYTLENWMAMLMTADGSGASELADDSTANLREFLAVPLVTGEHFERHLSALTSHLLTERYGPEMAGTILANRRGAIEDDGQAGQWVHTSSPGGGGSGNEHLSPLGECCLARHLATDYRLIATMLGDDEDEEGKAKRRGPRVTPVDGVHPTVSKACDWGDDDHREVCRSDLRSILLRHGTYLDATEGSCRVVLGMEMGGMEEEVRGWAGV